MSDHCPRISAMRSRIPPRHMPRSEDYYRGMLHKPFIDLGFHLFQPDDSIDAPEDYDFPCALHLVSTFIYDPSEMAWKFVYAPRSPPPLCPLNSFVNYIHGMVSGPGEDWDVFFHETAFFMEPNLKCTAVIIFDLVKMVPTPEK